MDPVDGSEVLVAFYLFDFPGDLVFCVEGGVDVDVMAAFGAGDGGEAAGETTSCGKGGAIYGGRGWAAPRRRVHGGRCGGARVHNMKSSIFKMIRSSCGSGGADLERR